MSVKVTFRPNGRFGNNVFQYIATKVLQKYIPEASYSYQESIKVGDNVLTVTEHNWNETLQGLRNKKEELLRYNLYYCDGYFQFNDFIEEERDYIQSLFSVDNKDILCSGLPMSGLVFFVSHYNTPFTDDDLVVTLVDGRKLSVPIVWFPKLANATLEQLHWPDIDEDLSIAGLLRGTD